MAVVVMHAVVSMDGYIADTDDEVGPLFEWYFNGDVEIVDGGPFKVSKASATTSASAAVAALRSPTARRRSSRAPSRPGYQSWRPYPPSDCTVRLPRSASTADESGTAGVATFTSG